MEIVASLGIQGEFPNIFEVLNDVKHYVRCKDKDLRVSELRIEARLSSNPTKFSGMAYSKVCSQCRNRYYFHGNGLIKMNIGACCDEGDIVRLFGHELRHICQAHRGRRKTGHLTFGHITEKQAEDDAYEFEQIVVDYLI